MKILSGSGSVATGYPDPGYPSKKPDIHGYPDPRPPPSSPYHHQICVVVFF
ncbi:unnamed protein product [Arabidopsis lyrata]|nr:unnamed protein product [Arabidopsis lyrata]